MSDHTHFTNLFQQNPINLTQCVSHLRVHLHHLGAVVVQSPSCVPLCDPMDHSPPGFPVLHHLLELKLMSTEYGGGRLDKIQIVELHPQGFRLSGSGGGAQDFVFKKFLC